MPARTVQRLAQIEQTASPPPTSTWALYTSTYLTPEEKTFGPAVRPGARTASTQAALGPIQARIEGR
jgi:hypothetical protein